MWFASSGANNVAILAWLAPIPLLAVLPDLRFVLAVAVAFTASAIGALSWLVAYGPLAFALIFMVAIPFTAVAAIWQVIVARAHAVTAAVTFPVLIVAAEFLFSRISPHGTLGSTAYTQGDSLLILQMASLTGMWGVSFILALPAAAAAVAWRCRQTRTVAGTVLVTGIVPLIVVLVFGFARLALPPLDGQAMVGLVASDVETARRLEQGRTGEPLDVLHSFVSHIHALASQGAEIVVLPEKFVAIAPEHDSSGRTILSAAARERQITLGAGWYLAMSSEPRNVAVVFGPGGDVIFEYDKQHLIPGIEWGYRRGTSLGVLPGQSPPTGVAICKDLDFVPLGRAYAQAGVGLLLVPAWDFVRDRWLHSRMAVMRGVEGGYAIARTATDGLLTVSDRHGRIVAERASSEADAVLLNATVPVSAGGTFYSRTGDWFAWLCVIAALASFLFALMPRALRPKT